MNANARLTTIPGAKKSRKKGRRDKPFRELRMCLSIMEKLHKRDPKPKTPAPKPYVPQVITDFPPPLNPKAAKKVRRKQRRKYQKELAKWEKEQAEHRSKEDAAAQAEAQATLKRKADKDLYQDVTKKSRIGEAASDVEERKKLEPKTRKSQPKPKSKPAPPNNKPEPKLGELPIEILRDVFGYRDSFDRTCIALTCKTFASIIMQDLLDWKNPLKDDKDTKTTEKGSQKGAGAAGKKTSKNEPKKEERKGFNMTAGFPDVRKRYNWDGERHATMEHLHSSVAPDQLYRHVCRIYKAKNGGTVTSYKNCPKKTLMANKASPNQDANPQLPASMLTAHKVEKEKPIPDKLVWTEEDWSVFKLGAIRSRMGIVQTCYLCPSCTDSRNSFLFPPPPETPLERFIEYDNPIGGDLKNGRVPYGQEGPNVRDPRRIYPPEEKLATVEDNAREAGKALEREAINNG